MDNSNRPASPQPICCEPNSTPIVSWQLHSDWAGFTKLEKAALMIAQGMLSAGQHVDPGFEGNFQQVAVAIAKAVLEEANK